MSERKQRFSAFVTGTDTEVGKTLVTAGLLKAFEKEGYTTLGLKPLAAGCENTEDGLRNEDALLLQHNSTEQVPYSVINPVAFEPAIAPHIAAMAEKRLLTASSLEGYVRGALLRPAKVKLIEGAGGWFTPLSYRETLADLPRLLKVPVILVVGMRLGCINHALLTAEAVRQTGLNLCGWVANRMDPDMQCYEENRDTLSNMLGAPLLGEVPHFDQVDIDQVAESLDVSALIEN